MLFYLGYTPEFLVKVLVSYNMSTYFFNFVSFWSLDSGVESFFNILMC